MRAKYFLNAFSISILCLCILNCMSQVNEDSVLFSKSEKWSVKQNKGLFGLSKPEFGNFVTINMSRSNSPVIKKKTKYNTSIDFNITGAGFNIDESKFLSIEKNKAYQLKLVTGADTIEAVFSISSISKEKKQTFLGKMISKNDKQENEILSYDRDISGVIENARDGVVWEFFIENFHSAARETVGNFKPYSSISGGYLKNNNDSFYILRSSSPANMILVNKSGEYYGAVKYIEKPLNIWIRNDIKDSFQKITATLFAIIISIKDL